MINLKKNKYNSLKGKFLVSSPYMIDERFKKTLIYIISDNESGSMGIIINKPALNISIGTVLGKLEINQSNKKNTQPKVFYGGPVELDKGFIVHTNDYKDEQGITLIGKNLALSSNISIIKDIVSGTGPSKSIFTIGYTGWSSYQLQSEMNQNAWMEIELKTDILFSKNHKKKWDFAISKLGINPKLLDKSIFTTYTGSA